MTTFLLFLLKWTPGAILFRFFSPIVTSAWRSGQHGQAAILTAVALLAYLYGMRAARRRVLSIVFALRG